MITKLLDELLGKCDKATSIERRLSRRRNRLGGAFENLEDRHLLAADLGMDPDGSFVLLDGDETAGTSTAEDTPLTISIVPPASSPLNGAGSITSISITTDTHGTVDNNGDGSVTYTPASNYTGLAKFLYTIDDMDADGGYIIVDVTADNDAPTQVVPGTQTVDEDSTGNSISGIVVSDIDAGSGSLITTITAGTGLLDATASGGAMVSGGGTGALTVTGNLTDLNATLASLTYDPTIQIAGSDTLDVQTDDDGNTPGPAKLSSIDSITININGVNDAPTVSGPVSIGYSEDQAPGPAAGIIISDIDAGGDDIQTTVSVGSGELTFGGGLPMDVTSSGSPASSVTLTGPLSAINTYIGSLLYEPNDNFNGTDTLTVAVDDLGNNPSGNLTGSLTVDLNVSADNDPPVNTVPSDMANPINVAEDTLTSISGISVADLDLNETAMAEITVTVSATAGNVTLNGNTSPSETVMGDLATVNSLLAGLQYQGPANDGSSAPTLTVLSNDGGNTGGGSLTDSDTIFIQLTPVNDGPVVTVPDTSMTRISIDEDTSDTPSISVADVDSAGDGITVTVSTNQGGTFSFAASGGATLTDNGTSTVVIDGNVTDVAATLGSASYSPAADFFGDEDVTVAANDNGFNGVGGALTDSKVFGYTVNPINDPPSFTIEDLGNGGAGVLSTVLEDAGPQTVAGVVANISAGPANESGQGLAFSVSGTPMGAFSSIGIDSSSGELSYTLTPDFNGSVSIDVTLTDDGGTPGSMSPETDDDESTTLSSLSLTVTPVNDQPDFSLGANPNLMESASDQSVMEPGFLTVTTLGAANESGQAIIDVDVQNNNPGFFTASNEPAIDSVTGDLTFEVAANMSGVVLVDVFIQDDGGTSDGGIDTSITRTFSITVSGVNQAPTISLPGALTTDEDTTGIFDTIDLDDPDSGPNDLQVDLAVSNGTLNLASTSGLTITDTSDNPISLPASSVRLTGSLSDLDAALLNDTMGNGLSYHPNSNYNGSDTLTIAVDDLGNTGTGGSLTDSGSVSISVTPVNDPVVLITMFADVNAIEDDPDKVIALGITPFVGSDFFADPDTGDTPPEAIGLTISSSDPSVVTANQSFGNLILDYQPSAFGTSTITVTAEDTGGNSATDTFLVTVADDPDAPVVANPISDMTEPEDSTITVDLDGIPVFDDADVPFGDSLTYSVSVAGPGILTASIDVTDPMDRKLVLSPNADQNSPLDGMMAPIPTVVSVTATDSTLQSVTDEFNVIFTPVNDAPIANHDAVTMDEDTGPLTIDVLANDEPGPPTATDEAGQVLSIVGVGSPASNGTAVFTGPNFTYTPNPNFSGIDSFTYTIQDDGSPIGSSMEATVTITVSPINDPPVITGVPSGPIPVAEDSTTGVVGITVDDVDSASITVDLSLNKGGSLSTTSISGTVADVNTALASLTYTPAPDANSGVNSLNSDETLTVNITDVEGLVDTPQTVDFNISPVNDAPRFNFLDATETQTEGPMSYTFDGSAVPGPADEIADGQTIAGYSLGMVTDPSSILDGTPTVDMTTGEIGYTLLDDAIGTATIDVNATDGSLDSTGTLTVTTVGVNKPPVITVLSALPVTKPVNAGSVDILNFAIISPGPDPGSPLGSDFPAGQKLTSIGVSVDNTGLFSVRPDFEIDTTATDGQGDEVVLGRLSFTTSPGKSGIANATITAFDDAGTPMNFADDISSTFNFQIIIGTPATDTTAPQVSGLEVSGTSWQPSFLGAVGGADGYPIPTGADQDKVLPWSGINRIHVRFDEPVKGSGTALEPFQPSDFSVTGINNLATVISSVSYNTATNTATLNLANKLGNDRYVVGASSATITDIGGNKLDGEWTNNVSTFDSGDGSAGGDFFFAMSVLPGDFNRSGTVDFFDLNDLGLAFNKSVGDASYSIFTDSTGDGNVNFFELNDLGLNFDDSLPSPALPAVAAAVDDIFEELDKRELKGQNVDLADDGDEFDFFA